MTDQLHQQQSLQLTPLLSSAAQECSSPLAASSSSVSALGATPQSENSSSLDEMEASTPNPLPSTGSSVFGNFLSPGKKLINRLVQQISPRSPCNELEYSPAVEETCDHVCKTTTKKNDEEVDKLIKVPDHPQQEHSLAAAASFPSLPTRKVYPSTPPTTIRPPVTSPPLSLPPSPPLSLPPSPPLSSPPSPLPSAPVPETTTKSQDSDSDSEASDHIETSTPRSLIDTSSPDADSDTLVQSHEHWHSLDKKNRDSIRDRSRFNVTCKTVIPPPRSRLPYAVSGYFAVKKHSDFMDPGSGVYSIPVRGVYRFGANYRPLGKGKLRVFVVHGEDSRRSEVKWKPGVFGDFWGEDNLECEKGEDVWLEIDQEGGSASTKDLSFFGRLNEARCQ